MSDRQGHCRLAYPTGSNDRHEAPLSEFSCEVADDAVSPQHARRPPGQADSERGGRYVIPACQLGGYGGDGCCKAVTPTRDIRDIATARFTVTEDFPKGGNVDPQTALVDHQRPPGAGDQITFTYDPRRMLDQCRENIQSSAADLERDAVFLENSLGWTQPKGSELYYTAKCRLSCRRIGMGFAEFAMRLRIGGRFMRFLLRLVKTHVQNIVRVACERLLRSVRGYANTTSKISMSTSDDLAGSRPSRAIGSDLLSVGINMPEKR